MHRVVEPPVSRLRVVAGGAALVRALERVSFANALDGSLASEHPLPLLGAERPIAPATSTNRP